MPGGTGRALGSHQTRVILAVCAYGFLKDIRPTTPFLTPHLMINKGLNASTLYSEVYPVWSYSYLFMLVPVFILTDLFRYKPILVSEALAYVATWLLIIFGSNVRHMQTMQVLFGWGSAAKVAYEAYLYAVLDRKMYRQVTSYVKCATMAGKTVSYGAGQTLIATGLGSYSTLDYISLTAVSGALFISILLPSVDGHLPSSRYPCNDPEDPGAGQPALTVQPEEKGTETLTQATIRNPVVGLRIFLKFAAEHVKDLVTKAHSSYSDRQLVKWSLFWSLGVCGYVQIGNYIQNLWVEIHPDQSKVYHGLVEFVNTFLGVGIVFAAQYLKAGIWKWLGEAPLAAAMTTQCVILLMLRRCQSLVVAYVLYIAYCGTTHLMSVVTTYNVARLLQPTSHGLIFGINTFLGMILHTILTFIVVDYRGLNLPIRQQFAVYAWSHAAAAGIFVLIGATSVFQTVCACCKNTTQTRNADAEEIHETKFKTTGSQKLDLPTHC